MSCCSICAAFFLRSHSRDHFRNWQLTVSNTFFCVLCANTSFCLAHDKWKVHFNEHWTMAQCSSVSLHLIIFDYGWTPRGFSLQSPAANGIYYVMSLLILMLSTRKTHDKCSFASQFTRHQVLHTSILCCVFSNASGPICGTRIYLFDMLAAGSIYYSAIELLIKLVMQNHILWNIAPKNTKTWNILLNHFMLSKEDNRLLINVRYRKGFGKLTTKFHLLLWYTRTSQWANDAFRLHISNDFIYLEDIKAHLTRLYTELDTSPPF